MYRRAPVRWGWEWECDRPLVVDAIDRPGPGHGDINLVGDGCDLSMPCPYSFAIARFGDGCDRAGGAGARRYEYFGDGCDVVDAVPLQVSRSFVFPYGCDRAGGAGARREEYFGDGCDFIDAVPLQIWGGGHYPPTQLF